MVGNGTLKFAVAGAVLAFAAAGTPVFAASRNYDCADCPVSRKYDSEEHMRETAAAIRAVLNNGQ